MAFMDILSAGAGIIGSLFSHDNTTDAIREASRIQSEFAQKGMDTINDNLTKVKNIFMPYQNAGQQGLEGQKNILGLNGNQAQQDVMTAILNSPMFKDLVATGENSILQNASATGGLRGGNTQAALAKFSPAIANQLVNQQYDRLSGLTQLGYGSAGQEANINSNASTQIANLLGQQGAAQAGGVLGVAKADNDLINSITKGAGSIFSSLGSGGGGGGGGFMSALSSFF